MGATQLQYTRRVEAALRASLHRLLYCFCFVLFCLFCCQSRFQLRKQFKCYGTKNTNKQKKKKKNVNDKQTSWNDVASQLDAQIVALGQPLLEEERRSDHVESTVEHDANSIRLSFLRDVRNMSVQ